VNYTPFTGLCQKFFVALMLSNANQNLLHNQGINSSKATQMKDIKTPEKKIKFIPCDEFSQTFSFQRTNKKSKTSRFKC
jgi:hypothetical protein